MILEFPRKSDGYSQECFEDTPKEIFADKIKFITFKMTLFGEHQEALAFKPEPKNGIQTILIKFESSSSGS